MKTALCLGGNGFICHHMARRLKSEGYWVRVVDIKEYGYGKNNYADEIIIGDLRDPNIIKAVCRIQNKEYSYLPKPFEPIESFDEIVQMGALMGGASFVFTGEHDADIMHDSAIINLNLLNWCAQNNFKGKIFYSSSACMYPQELQGEYITLNEIAQLRKHDFSLKESDAYPANPDSEYGWEKLFSERLYLAYERNYGLNIRIARFHNIYGPEGTYKGGKEKAPAAMCRKIIESNAYAPNEGGLVGTNEKIEVWGDGKQTRSFLYIDDCIDAIRLLMTSDFKEPINIGSEEMVSINDLAQMAIDISGKQVAIKNIEGPTGVRGRNSNNDLIRKVLNWEPKYKLREGMELTYQWIKQTIECGNTGNK